MFGSVLISLFAYVLTKGHTVIAQTNPAKYHQGDWTFGVLSGQVSYTDVAISSSNPAGVNFGAALSTVAFHDPDLIPKRFFKSETNDSVVVNVYKSFDGQPVEKTINFGDITKLYSNDVTWPGAIAKAFIDAGFQEDFPGVLAPFDISKILGIISGKKPVTIYKASEDESKMKDDAFNKKLLDTKFCIVQTKVTTKTLKKNYAYAVGHYTPQNGDMRAGLFDPSVERTVWKRDEPKIPTIEQIKADTDYVICTE